MTLNQALQKLKQSSVDKTLLQVAGDIKSLIQEKKRILNMNYRASTILESRLSDVDYVWEIGVGGCGAIAGLAHYFFKNLGYQSKLIDGHNNKSRTHAWIIVVDNGAEVSLDFTISDFGITPDYEEERRCDSWWDIKDILFKKHTGEYWTTLSTSVGSSQK